MSASNTPRHALVIGAGLAGAAIGVNLARRGWAITLLDAAAGPSCGASALPVGMLSPHITRAPTPLSRLSELGVADMRQQLEGRVAPGFGWQTCEVDNRGHNAGRWPAAMVRPAAIVQAWLDEIRSLGPLETRWNAQVQRLHPRDGQWLALDTHGRTLAQAPVVVVAAAFGSYALLQHSLSLNHDHLPLRPVQGQLSYGAQEGQALAARPQRDHGVFIPAYEDGGLPPGTPARIWAMGSTYERGKDHCLVTDQAHERNLESLFALCPEAAEHMRQTAAAGRLFGWSQVRCASLDRLPLVGGVPRMDAQQPLTATARGHRTRLPLAEFPRWPGLYLLSALGSRGLTLAHWCATRLAAQIDGDMTHPPEDVLDLTRSLDSARFAWRQWRRQAPPQVIPDG